ncbi:hypothetical protein PBAL39_07095 [Pedobacter sp. BAL39]|nr:hypothetical protein PBAL39_07095 [Pedobacter sp. BAL39]
MIKFKAVDYSIAFFIFTADSVAFRQV